MAFLSKFVKVADLSTLSALTNTVDGIIDGSLRLVSNTSTGPAWYRYRSPSSLSVISPMIVSGEAGVWERIGDRVLATSANPTGTPPYTGAFHFNSASRQLFAGANNAWNAVSSSVEPLATPAISSNILPLDLSVAYCFKSTLNQNITSFSITNVPTAANSIISFLLILDYSTAQYTIPTSANLTYNGSSIPTTPSAAGQSLMLLFQSTNGINWLVSSNTFGY